MDEEKNTPQQPNDTPADADAPIVPQRDDDDAPIEDAIVPITDNEAEAFTSEADTETVSGDADNFAFADDLDIESALASVANLSALITDTTEMVQLDAPSQKPSAKETPPPVFTSDFPRPPMLTLERGQLPSVIPALALMSIGAGLSFLLITGAESVNTSLVNLLAIGGICLMLLLVWLASGRWARGALFLALAIASTTGILAVLPQTSFGIDNGLPLVLCGWGASVIVSGILSPKRTAQGFFGGVVLMVIGAVAFVYKAGYLPLDIAPFITQYGAIIGGVAGALLFIPAIFKRHR